MPGFHANTDLDPDAEARKLIRFAEAEALDEDQLFGMLTAVMEPLEWRRQICQQRRQAAAAAALGDARNMKLRSKIKGVKEAPFPDEKRVEIALPGIIPSKGP